MDVWQHCIFVIIFAEDWLVGCFGFNGPLRQYFSLNRAVSQREREREREREGESREMIDERKNV